MQRVTKRLLNIALLFVAVSLLVSCAMGSAYKKVDKIPDGMGVVYIYRPSSIMGPAAADVDANRVGITSLSKGGYYPYFSKPGEVEFSSQVRIKSTVTLYRWLGSHLQNSFSQSPFQRILLPRSILILR